MDSIVTVNFVAGANGSEYVVAGTVLVTASTESEAMEQASNFLKSYFKYYELREVEIKCIPFMLVHKIA